ncbi:MAG: hypothetical protein MI755_16425 [Sphingomonadales bacterium]|nr:hypothetical protein [Sphingomonadales bacterium]
MGKKIDDSVYDAALNKIKTDCDQMTICKGEPATVYEAIDPPQWAASTAYQIGDAVRPATRDGNVYECTTAGTSGGSEPTFDVTPGNTTNDNGVVWTARASKAYAAQAMVAGDFSIANGDTSGRKVNVAAKSGITNHRSGTALDHAALIDKGVIGSDDPVLLAVTTLTATINVNSPGTTDLAAFDALELLDPT